MEMNHRVTPKSSSAVIFCLLLTQQIPLLDRCKMQQAELILVYVHQVFAPLTDEPHQNRKRELVAGKACMMDRDFFRLISAYLPIKYRN